MLGEEAEWIEANLLMVRSFFLWNYDYYDDDGGFFTHTVATM